MIQQIQIQIQIQMVRANKEIKCLTETVKSGYSKLGWCF